MATAKKGNKMGDTVYLGVDDGHHSIKIVSETGEEYSIPSRAARGKRVITLPSGDEGVFYDTEEGHSYTVSQHLPEFEDTRFMGYPKSELNRVLVHDALRRASYGGRAVQITTGLPVSYYYLPSGEPHQALIDAKIANLSKRVSCGDLPVANILRSTVTTEAVAAIVDQLMDMDGVPSKNYEALTSMPIGVVDVGGKTTDCAVLLPGTMVDVRRSGSNDVGVLQLLAAIGSKLKVDLGLDTEPPPVAVERAMRTGTIRIYGKDKNVQEIVDAEKEWLADQIMTAVRTKIGSGADLDHVLFVGGGAIVLKDQLLKHFPHALVPEKPEFANARGMLKIAKYVA